MTFDIYMVSAFLGAFLCPVVYFLSVCYWSNSTGLNVNRWVHLALHVVVVLIPPVLLFVGLQEMLTCKERIEVALLVTTVFWGLCYWIGGERGAREATARHAASFEMVAPWWNKVN